MAKRVKILLVVCLDEYPQNEPVYSTGRFWMVVGMSGSLDSLLSGILHRFASLATANTAAGRFREASGDWREWSKAHETNRKRAREKRVRRN